MKLYLLTDSKWNNHYEQFDKCIVCAENEEDAKTIEPIVSSDGYTFRTYDETPNPNRLDSWVRCKADILCEEIGTANENQKRGLILGSFNAG